MSDDDWRDNWWSDPAKEAFVPEWERPDYEPQASIKMTPFMAGWYITLYIFPKYDLTEEQKQKTMDAVANYFCGMTPYKSWREAAVSYCKAFAAENKKRGKL